MTAPRVDFVQRFLFPKLTLCLAFSVHCLGLGFGLGLCGHVYAGEADDATMFFESSIRPLLVEHCLDCHSSDTEASGGLELDSRVGWEEGGDLGTAVVPGEPTLSLLITAIEFDDPDLQMPPDGKLDQKAIDAFRKWVELGAPDPREPSQSGTPANRSSGLSVADAQDHWAYRPLSTQTGFSIDGWIDARLNEAGLVPAAPAERRVLARRLSFDLCGLPPTRELVDAFVKDDSPDAYEHLIENLLSSPAYGEHLARRWMDVARYAESITLRGFILPEAWRYRDYLIESFNSDRPFDQMIRDQLAGDLLPSADPEETRRRAIATAFLAMGNSNLEDQDKTKLEFDHLDEQLETIGRAFLAQTIGCARCHDHKFDPIPTRDYYALAGIFRSTTPLKHANLSKWIEQPLPLEASQQVKYELLDDVLKKARPALRQLDEQIKELGKSTIDHVDIESLPGFAVDDNDATFVGEWTESSFIKPYVGSGYRHDGTTGQGMKTATFEPANLPTGDYEVRLAYTAHANRATNVTVTVFSANESKTILVNQRKTPDINGVWISLGTYPFEADGQAFVIVSNANADGCVIADAVQFIPAEGVNDGSPVDVDAVDQKKLAKLRSHRAELAKQLSIAEAELNGRPKYLTIMESEPKLETNIRIRGNTHQLGDPVPRGFLSAIGPASEYASLIDQTGSGRVQLAGWIADSRNPLTARVYANRVWSWLMGEGLVPTENNFGTTGRSPTHPELLDYLADELIRHDWSTKHLVRLIVSSKAYRRSTAESEMCRSIDPENQLWSRFRMKRLPVESVRDAMLFFSGELRSTMFGETIREGTKSDYDYQHGLPRRSVYQPVFRNSLPPLFEVFDFADASVSVGQRSRSTVVSQSLAMMNDPWVIKRATKAAERYRIDFQSPSLQLIDEIYQDCFGRLPSDDERQLCLTFLNASAKESFRQKLVDLIQSLFASTDFRYLE
ncbi:DUF1553 domain-containing protein [Stieleria sp. JC731]|uniref:DUF1553 domain-containing protein n=1 Tax=Pirellulaceae TaxID=2691357 RepID=UPI001E44130B|nr:DUF1553 domain-containing protein [Stieleria sp. JC731]MCC9601144.1 DUF1553 domain-containing protein [Stieleria sp. JC731]